MDVTSTGPGGRSGVLGTYSMCDLQEIYEQDPERRCVQLGAHTGSFQ
jgi:hypothetical protein